MEITDAKSKRQQNRLKRKEAKSKAVLLKHADGLLKISETPTTTMCVSNAGLGNGLSKEHVYSWLSGYANILDIVMVERKPYCFIVVGSVEDGEKIALASGSHVQHEGIPQPVEHFIHYVTGIPQESLPATQLPNGLHLLTDYISKSLEEQLLGLVHWQDHDRLREQTAGCGGSLKNRSVKHFGYEFKYSNNNVDPDQPLSEGIPGICKEFCDRLIADGHMTEQPDQLTVNKYEPGQGIPPHVDTHSAFIGPIISLSLGSHVLMAFTSPCGEVRQVFLPARSVLVMSGESRYKWTHGIVPRKTDIIHSADGLNLTYRQTRVSFTFRRLRRAPCRCDYREQCDSQNYGKGGVTAMEELTDKQARKLEELHVHQVYDTIATHFSGTRHSQWPRVAEFIASLPAGSIVADIGCGNGKYLLNNKDQLHFKVGFERSGDLAAICQGRGYPIVQADCLATPLRDHAVDACLCIAVIHHLSTQARRKAAVAELLRILRPGGSCLIYVWAIEQKKGTVKSTYLKSSDEHSSSSQEYLPVSSGDCQLPVHRNRTEFVSSDMLVPWNLKPSPSSPQADTTRPDSHLGAPANQNNLFHRYYHIFKDGELEALCSSVKSCRVLKSYYDQGNWCVVFTKDV